MNRAGANLQSLNPKTTGTIYLWLTAIRYFWVTWKSYEIAVEIIIEMITKVQKKMFS